MQRIDKMYGRILLFVAIIIMLLNCLFLSGCSGNVVKTDVDTEAELLEIMKQSGEYDFYDAVEFDVFTDEVFSENYKTSDNSTDLFENDNVSENMTTSDHKSDVNETFFILNNGSKKFHTPECIYAEKIKKDNYDTAYVRDEIISNGYQPCKVCNP